MRFKVTSRGNHSTCGDLFFSLPTQQALEWATEQVAQLCREKAQGIHRERLEEELARMQERGAAFHFLLMQEVCQLSPGGIMLQGDTAGSLISKYLGLSALDVLDPMLVENNLSTPTEFIWGLPGSGKLPVLDACIHPDCREQIHRQLDSKYGRTAADDNLFRQIGLIDRHKTVRSQQVPAYTPQLCLAVLHQEARDTAAHTQALFEEGAIHKDLLESILSLTREMLELQECDLPTLVRLYGYLRGNFTGRRQIQNLREPYFFTTREELYQMLLALEMPKAEALDMVKQGVWSQGKKRDGYIARLQNYNAPASLLDAFSRTDNIWSAASILSRIHFLMQTI